MKTVAWIDNADNAWSRFLRFLILIEELPINCGDVRHRPAVIAVAISVEALKQDR